MLAMEASSMAPKARVVEGRRASLRSVPGEKLAIMPLLAASLAFASSRE